MSRLLPPCSNKLSRIIGLVLIATVAVWLGFAVGPRIRGLLVNTILLALGSWSLAFPVALLAAILLAKTESKFRPMAAIFALAFLAWPLHSVTVAWQAGWGTGGWWEALRSKPTMPLGVADANWIAAIVVHAIVALPGIVCFLLAGLYGIPASTEEQSLLERSGGETLLRVTLPQVIPFVMGGFLWTTIQCATEIGATDVFRIRTFAEEVFVQATAGPLLETLQGYTASSGYVEEPLSSRGLLLGTTLVVISLAGLSFLCMGRISVAAGGTTRGVRLLTGKPALALGLITCLVLGGTLALGVQNLLWHLGREFASVPGEQSVRESWSLAKVGRMLVSVPREHAGEFWASGRIAIAAAITSVSTSVVAAWYCRSTVKSLFLLLVALAIWSVPGPLWGVTTILVLNQPHDSAWSFLSVIYNESRFGLAPWLVQTIRCWPLCVILCVPAIRSLPTAMLDEVRLRGMGGAAAITRVVWPMRWPVLLLAGILAAINAWSEISATQLVAPPGVTPIAVRTLNLVHYGVDDRLAALVLFQMAVTITPALCFATFVALRTIKERVRPAS